MHSFWVICAIAIQYVLGTQKRNAGYTDYLVLSDEVSIYSTKV